MTKAIIPPSPQDGARQRATLLRHLTQYGQISTLEARGLYGVMSPACRIMELRRAGHQIDTVRLRAPDASGQIHSQGLYVYRGAK